MSDQYHDIINLPHPRSTTHAQMPIANRAAQFSPFAALTGYEAAIAETARLTDARIALDENAMDALEVKLRMLTELMAEKPTITVTYFRADERKAGGAYVSATGVVKRIDEYENAILLTSGKWIPITDILDIECALFEGL